jgi:hypothetical protein
MRSLIATMLIDVVVMERFIDADVFGHYREPKKYKQILAAALRLSSFMEKTF